MIKNYLKSTFNNIKKHKFFSIINILGLSIGITSALFVALHVTEELSYDHFNEFGDRIYRVKLTAQLGDQALQTTTTPGQLANTLNSEVPGIENATRLQSWGSTSFMYEDKKFIEQDAIVADSNFFELFTYPLLHGDKNTALDNPNSVVLNEDLAMKYFGSSSEAIDKLMVINGDSVSFKVTGVIKNIPGNSHLKFTAILSKNSFASLKNENWGNNNVQTYYVLNENASVEQINEQLEVIAQKYVSPMFEQFMGGSLDQMRANGGDFRYLSQPLYNIHLYSSLDDELDAQGDISYIYILIAIGVFILAIASINFMNLSTAKSANRAKEVGLRKTMGATRGQLIGQFLTESMAFSIISAVLALLMVYMFLPSYNLLTGKLLLMASIFQPSMMGILIFTVLLVGLLAGSYPAFYLTSFEVMDVIKGKLNAGSKNKSVRGVLVTFQFWISIVLIISTAIVYRQLEYAQNKKLGIDKDQILYVISTQKLKDNRAVYKTALDAFPDIEASSYMSTRFPNMNNNSVFKVKGDDKDIFMGNYRTDYDQQSVMGFELSEGRFFSPEYLTDSTAIIVNEAAVAEMGWKNPLEKIILRSIDDEGTMGEFPVIGVVKDFNFESVKEDIRPMLMLFTKTASSLAIRFNGSNYQEVINKAQNEWDKLVPNEPFEYTFMAEDYDAMFRSEQRLMKLFTILTGLAIFIAALGLFGLTAFTAEQRTKEIGIRKALGASVWDINNLLTKEFNKLVLIAFVLAIYPVYYLMNGWLDNFAFRITMGIGVFLMGGIISLVISWLTVSFQAQKVARANPMDALKYE